MKGRTTLLTRTLLTAALLVAALLTGAQASSAAGSAPAARAVCASAPAGHVRCLALVDTGRRAMAAGGQPAGYAPADLEAAYSLPIARGANETVAIVDAYDDPNAAADLAVYRHTYGLPPCTVASGCLRKLNQTGQAGDYPAADGSWSLEISLDLDMVSAACPRCRIVLVEADSSFTTDLAAAEDVATATGAIAVSNSYGADEFAAMTTLAAHYRHAGTSYVASSGDLGFTTAQYPAVLPTVLAVGGTSLTPNSSVRGYVEHAWSGGSSGCSAYVAKPSWQVDTHCHLRTVADVAADADPATGVAVYDTVPYLGQTWYVVGGTSAASPLVAGVVALSGRAVTPSYVYAHHGELNDVVGGSNATASESCGGDYLCVAKKGYDAPTGWGTPNGASAF